MVFQRAVNEYNGVREFGLVFPDEDDSRSLVWFTLDSESERYHEASLSPGAEVEVAGWPGLVLRAKPSHEWERGRKLEVWFRGILQLPLNEERQRAEQEQARAAREQSRSERLADKLRELGVDPDE